MYPVRIVRKKSARPHFPSTGASRDEDKWSLTLFSCFALAATFSVSVLVSSIADAADLLFKKHVISDQTDYSAAALIDVNHDGQIDIVCGGDWYEGPNWEQHFVAEIPRIGGRPDGFAHLEFDVNRDGWVDVITVNFRSRSIKWMEHPGESLGPWTNLVTSTEMDAVILLAKRDG